MTTTKAIITHQSFQRKALLFLLILLVGSKSNLSHASRLVTFEYVEDSAICGQSDGEWNFRLDEFHIDCGNANHGCTPGTSMMIYGQFEALDKFYTVADIDIGACVLGSMICTPNLVEADMNLCADLELWDLNGYQQCNQVGTYTFEASYLLPNHTWYEDFAVEGFKFSIYITLGHDLTCYAHFVTHVWYGSETWMAFTVCSSLAFVLGVYYYSIHKKRQQQQQGKINLTLEEAKSGEEGAEKGRGGESEMVTVVVPSAGTSPKKQTPRSLKGGGGKKNRSSNSITDDDDESVTSTAYLRMLDFSPEGLRRADRMERVKQAHFDRQSRKQKSRHGSSSKGLLSGD